MQNFRRLAVWHKAHSLLVRIHRHIKLFRREYSNIRSQLRRAAESVPANIVEGCGRQSQKEFANYLQNAISSANEVEYELLQARDYGLLTPHDWEALTADVMEIRRMLFGLVKKVRADILREEPSRIGRRAKQRRQQ